MLNYLNYDETENYYELFKENYKKQFHKKRNLFRRYKLYVWYNIPMLG